MARMGHLEVAHVDYYLPTDGCCSATPASGWGRADVVALVGPNGAGKSTLLKLASGELNRILDRSATSGGLGVMPQFVGSVRDERTVRDLLVAVARPSVRAAALAVDAAELAIMERDDEAAQMAYAQALSDWGDAGGYPAETVWDMCTMAALGVPYEKAQWRQVRTLSGGEQKRLVLEALLRGPDEVLLLDEPDNYLTLPGKLWLEGQLRDTAKTVLFVSHDRELLAQAASVIVSVEPAPGGSDVWVTTAAGPRTTRRARTASNGSRSLRRRWGRKARPSSRSSSRHAPVRAARSDAMASRYAAAQTRLRMFEEAGPPPDAAPQAGHQDAAARRPHRQGGDHLRGPGTSPGLMNPFSLEVFYGVRVAVLGSNGSAVAFPAPARWTGCRHAGSWKLGARVVPGSSPRPTPTRNWRGGRWSPSSWDVHARDRGAAMSVLRRYEC